MKPRKFSKTFWAIFCPKNDLYPGSIRCLRCNSMDHVTKGSGKAWLELLDQGYTCRRIRIETIERYVPRKK